MLNDACLRSFDCFEASVMMGRAVFEFYISCFIPNVHIW